ncbi:hypothetical protein FYC62_15060 [Pedobacter aquae]|uniref:Uncharacterized protein n=1 Tax=Pedobacter aquae TaxID=2605747 RepID=A0A5C0VKZ8_9SPHI|nr:hypothetical protein [Pedobacter aquae]QEK52811.1 hypothetical protein FYC62_14915 [Pedobacter aquae]QEK52837.1 hypothetical protein FYC62_15060 [Pedobacter aquae]
MSVGELCAAKAPAGIVQDFIHYFLLIFKGIHEFAKASFWFLLVPQKERAPPAIEADEYYF